MLKLCISSVTFKPKCFSRPPISFSITFSLADFHLYQFTHFNDFRCFDHARFFIRGGLITLCICTAYFQYVFLISRCYFRRNLFRKSHFSRTKRFKHGGGTFYCIRSIIFFSYLLSLLS